MKYLDQTVLVIPMTPVAILDHCLQIKNQSFRYANPSHQCPQLILSRRNRCDCRTGSVFFPIFKV